MKKNKKLPNSRYDATNPKDLASCFNMLRYAEKDKCSIELNLDEEKELKQYGEVEVERYGFLFLIENDGAGGYVITMMCPFRDVTFASQKLVNNIKNKKEAEVSCDEQDIPTEEEFELLKAEVQDHV